MPTKYSRRLYSSRRQTRSGRAYNYPKRSYYSQRSSGRYRGYGSYASIAPYALRAIPYLYRGYKSYQRGGLTGVRRYAGKLATSAARSAIRTVTGYGAYSGMKGGIQGKMVPKIRNGGQDNGTVVISNEEYLGDVISSITQGKFLNNQYTLNPGNSNTFPWLSSLAKNFQEYRFEGLCFTYKSMSGDSLTSANTALGTVIMATTYDPTQPVPSSKAEMENIEFANSTKPSSGTKHFVETAKGQNVLSNLYVTSNPGNITGDRRFYDFGIFNIATQGMQGTGTNIGELWVSYQVRLFKPLLYDALGKDVEVFSYSGGSELGCQDATPLGTVDIAHLPLANVNSYFPGNTLFPLAYSPATAGLLFPPTGIPKMYRIFMQWESAAGTTIILPTLSYINCTSETTFLSGASIGRSTLNVPTSGKTAAERTCFQWVARTDGANTNQTQPWGWQFTALGEYINGTASFFHMDVTEIPYVPLP